MFSFPSYCLLFTMDSRVHVTFSGIHSSVGTLQVDRGSQVIIATKEAINIPSEKNRSKIIL